MFKKLSKKFNDPHFTREFHKWAAIVWFIAGFPIMIFFADSVPVLVFISVYANVAGHWSGFQASDAEIEAQD